MTDATYWNGERCEARRTRVIVPEWREGDPPAAWWRDVVGTERAAVLVHYGDQRFILDDDDGSGWAAVTVHRGGPHAYKASLPNRTKILGEVDGTTRYTIAVDFDGVLHPYTAGWVGVIPADELPVAGAAAALEELHWRYHIIVFSTRCRDTAGSEAVWAWLRRHGLADYIAEVTCQKPGALAYIDDRAVTFTGDWTQALADTADLVVHGPWNKELTL